MTRSVPPNPGTSLGSCCIRIPFIPSNQELPESNLNQEISDIPRDTPPPLGGFITLTHYQDANLYHDIITGCSVTGILHFMNKMPIDLYSKKQATVEMATYGSEFISAEPASTRLLIYGSP
jgi:hypothetical protein